jgi:hypothetical protein
VLTTAMAAALSSTKPSCHLCCLLWSASSCYQHGASSVAMLPAVHCSRFLTPSPLLGAYNLPALLHPTTAHNPAFRHRSPPTHTDLQAHHALPVCAWRRGDPHQPTPALLRRPQ